ncbi:MAG: formamidopyrimidine-DNA glycosylase [Phycisphaerales bacterium]|nr:formamidopyrimidine-DNA glycosylase [Phycisphaerae bacterium]NNF43483.1 formamidopyrimidine-DNA glycosylase [Phycisphaerales bacterium]NNM26894.1 formamidopyrimidine-DNA glycosylase [Phycisphaerales bacterium]
MPELPDIELYLHCLRPRVVDETLERISIAKPFVLRSVDPPITDAEGRTVRAVRRLGKRIVLELEDNRFVVIHLMIAGRLRWFPREKPTARPRIGLASFTFGRGTLWLTEAGSKRRASLHVVRGGAALAEHDRGGLEVLESTVATFATRLRAEPATVKRALTEPRRFSGIGNAYSDEILHAARLSPLARTTQLDDEQVARLHAAVIETLRSWCVRLQEKFGARFPGPGQVTAFRPEMAVHGKFGEPCPVCGTQVERIVYAERETNYCPGCQTGGRVLKDRSLSRLLREDWPRSRDRPGSG